MQIGDLNLLVEKLAVLKENKDKLSEQVKSISSDIASIEEVISTALTENNLDSFKTKVGTAYHSLHNTVSVKDKQLFHNWLKQNEYYDSLVSVNSQTLKAFVKSLKPDEQTNPEIPGLEINDFIKLNFRRN